MFTERPDKFIPGAQIDLVKFHAEEAEGSDDFTEKTFYGPILEASARCTRLSLCKCN